MTEHLWQQGLEQIVHDAPVPIIVLDRNITVLVWNAAAEKTFGYQRDEVLGKPLPTVSPRSRAETQYFTDRVFAGETLQDLHVERFRRDGVVLDLLLSAGPLRDKDGEVVASIAAIVDITERKRIQDALDQTQTRFRELADSIADVFVAVDHDLRFTYWNRSAQLAIDVPAEDALGRHIGELFPVPETQQVEQAFRDVLATGNPTSFSSSAVIEGREITYEFHVYPFSEGLSVFARDIGPVRQSCINLRRQRSLAQTLIDTARAVVLVLDPNCRIVSYNSYLERLTGRPLSQTRGKDWCDTFIPAENRAEIRQVFAEAVEGRKPANSNDILCADGSVRHVEWTDAPLHDESGQLTALLAIGLDVTDRANAEQALRLSESRFRSIFESAGVGISISDADRRFLAVNPAFAQMVGYSQSDLIGKSADYITHPDDRAAANERFSLMESNKVGSYFAEKRFVHRDGHAVWVRLNVTRITEGRTGERAIDVVEDITEIKQIEEQFRQAQKMEAVGRLAGGVAHDFRNQLTVIKGYAEMLHDAACLDGPARSSVDEILRAVDRSSSLSRQLLSFSRKQVLHPQVIDPTKLIASLSDSLASMVGEDIYLVVLPAGRGAKVRVDPEQLEQALINLVANARDAIHGNGKVKIEIEQFKIDEPFMEGVATVQPGRYVTITVRDDGMGMDNETLSHVFEPFFTTKPTGEGTGLGLSMVYGFVRQSGGTITVRSAPGRGSVFRIYLPRAEGPVDPQPQAPVAAQLPRGTETILLVEDEQPVRKVVSASLRQQGYTVVEAHNARQATEQMRQHISIDLVITDMVMPGISGLALAETLRQSKPNLPILYISGYAQEGLIRRGLSGPFEEFLPKPIGAGQLAQTVRRILDAAVSNPADST